MNGFTIPNAEALCREHLLRQVIVLSWDGTETRVDTFGVTDQDSAIAAEAGNRIKRWLMWPESMCNSVSLKVQRLHDRIAELERQLEEIGQ